MVPDKFNCTLQSSHSSSLNEPNGKKTKAIPLLYLGKYVTLGQVCTSFMLSVHLFHLQKLLKNMYR